MTHVDWHPYPEEKPKNGNKYLITLKKYSGLLKIGIAYFDEDDWIIFNAEIQVIAWAELPEPYHKETN